MKKNIFNKAVTLLELIISTALVTVVLLGIFAINNVLSSNNQDYGQRYLLKSETQNMMNHILANASLAIGSGTSIILSDNVTVVPDNGVLVGFRDLGSDAQGYNVNSFCFHQDINPSLAIDSTQVNPTPSSAPNYTNSRWLCYTWFLNTEANFPTLASQMVYCVMPYLLSRPARGAGNCTTNNPYIIGVANYLGTQFNIGHLLSSGSVLHGPQFISSSSVPGSQMIFDITIQNCLDNSSPPPLGTGTCNGAGVGISLDPVNNPEVQLSGSVSPSQQGMQNN